MKRIIFFLILVVGSARLEAHAFLKACGPGSRQHCTNIARPGSNSIYREY